MSWLLTDVSILEGIAYFEFQPGRYAGKHRRTDSVFFTEDRFAHIEPIFTRHRPDFNPYGPTIVTGSQWKPILADLSTTEAFLASAPAPTEVFNQLGFLSAEDKNTFAREFESNVSELRTTIAILVRWIRQALESSDAISILGL